MAEDDSELDEDERTLFRRSVGKVTPLGAEPRVQPVRDAVDRRVGRVPERLPTGLAAAPEPVGPADALSYGVPGMQPRQLQRLRRGQLPAEALLDLHGLSQTQAQLALASFLHQARLRGLHCVTIVHGKGHGSDERHPVLKNWLNAALRASHEVLAFCSATPADGGTGAVYVALRQR